MTHDADCTLEDGDDFFSRKKTQKTQKGKLLGEDKRRQVVMV
jgi:gluconate kinase